MVCVAPPAPLCKFQTYKKLKKTNCWIVDSKIESTENQP